MPFEFIIPIVIISVLGLSLLGLVTIVRFIVLALQGGRSRSRDLQTARRVIEEIKTRENLSPAAYDEITEALERMRVPLHFGEDGSEHPQPQVVDRARMFREWLERGKSKLGDEPIEAGIVDPATDVISTKRSLPPVVLEPTAIPRPAVQPTSPWNLPDVPAPPSPQRTWREVFAVFMQDKNIRWGELASGILIVGSAVGLILSLRKQLLDVIPYFPALLFLLITAAIIAAGIYTLRRWRLQMTSRGILVIGLLLIPLNVLIGCWLTGSEQYKRALDDPVYWTAIAIELISLAALSWLAAKHLLRVRYAALLASVMASSAFTLLVNRIPDPSGSALRTAAWMSPFAAFFLLGVCGIAPRMNNRRWTGREIRRLLVNLGIAFFAVAVGVSLFFIKWPARTTAVAIAPTLALIAASLVWLGQLFYARQRSPNAIWTMVAISHVVLGILLIVGAVVASQIHPTLGLITALLASAIFIGQSFFARSAWLLLPAFVSLALATVTGTNLISEVAAGTGGWDRFTSASDYFRGLVAGRTGISLLVAAGAMAIGSKFLVRRFDDVDSRFRTVKFATLFGIAVLGVLLAVVASVLFPERQFDLVAATVLLTTIAITLLATTIFRPMERGLSKWLPTIAASFTFAALAHGLWWNKAIYFAVHQSLGANSPIPVGLGAFAMLMGVSAALFVRFGTTQLASAASHDVSRFYTLCSIGGSIGAWALSIPLFQNQLATATVIGLDLVAVWMLLAVSQNDARLRAGFAMSIAVAALLFVAEFGIRFGWYQEWTSIEFVLTCICALGLWCLPWTLLRRYTRGTRAAALFDSNDFRTEWPVAVTLVAVCVGLIAIGLLKPVCAEIASHGDFSMFVSTGLRDKRLFFTVALGLCAAAVLACCLEKVTSGSIAAFSWIWIGGWALAAINFESSVATASSLRWLIATSGLVLSLLIGCRRSLAHVWSRGARALGFAPQFAVTKQQRLFRIKVSLATGIVVVLGITGVVTAAIMVFNGRGISRPLATSFFGTMPAEVSYGVPIALLVATCLSYAVSQRRSWLAMLGSGVFQSCVAGAFVLLLISNNPAIASVRFIQILQVVSIGMSIYGAVWYWLRDRLEPASSTKQWSLLQTHTLVNIGLMVGLSGIIFSKFWTDGRIIGDWAKAIGGPAGIVAVALMIPLAVMVLPQALGRGRHWLIAAFGAILVAIATIHVDQISNWGILSIAFGMATVLAAQVAAMRKGEAVSSLSLLLPHKTRFAVPLPRVEHFPMAIIGTTSILFCERALATQFWPAYAGIGAVLFMALIYCCRGLSGWGLLAAYAVSLFCAIVLWRFQFLVNPSLSWKLGHFVNMMWLALLGVSLVVVAFLLIRARRADRMPLRFFTCWPSLVCIGGSAWFALTATQAMAFGNLVSINASQFPLSPMRIETFASLVALLGLQLWSVRARGIVPAACFCSVAAASLMLIQANVAQMPVCILLATAMVVALWGAVRWHRETFLRQVRVLGIARPASLQQKLERQIPVLVWCFAGVILPLAVLYLLRAENVNARLICALAPLPLAIAFYYLAGRPTNEVTQLVSASLLTISFVWFSWIDVVPLSGSAMTLATRTLTVVALSVFVFAVMIPRIARRGDAWLATLRRMTILTASCGIGILTFVVASLFGPLSEGRQVEVPLRESTGVVVAVMAMVTSLIAIAVRPLHNAFSFSIPLRKGFVYAAQLASVFGILYAVITIPWLFNLGLKHYWPYLMMGAALGGILLAKLLERRELTVLGQPLMNTAMTIPLAGAAGTLFSQTKSDSALVMLMAGMVYLVLSFVQRSMLASAAAMVFGNWALFCYYRRIPGFNFVDHPQLWLIPPALSVLLAVQFNRQRLTRENVALLRYASLGVIYVSSTSEIFIDGIGDQLWPPIVLAVLSLGGMVAGMLIQVRAFLFVGTLFLLMAMIAMVWHAGNRFEHNWPWWAFGICVGIVILVLLGLFEKRRNDLRRVAARLQHWDL